MIWAIVAHDHVAANLTRPAGSPARSRAFVDDFIRHLVFPLQDSVMEALNDVAFLAESNRRVVLNPLQILSAGEIPRLLDTPDFGGLKFGPSPHNVGMALTQYTGSLLVREGEALLAVCAEAGTTLMALALMDATNVPLSSDLISVPRLRRTVHVNACLSCLSIMPAEVANMEGDFEAAFRVLEDDMKLRKRFSGGFAVFMHLVTHFRLMTAYGGGLEVMGDWTEPIVKFGDSAPVRDAVTRVLHHAVILVRFTASHMDNVRKGAGAAFVLIAGGIQSTRVLLFGTSWLGRMGGSSTLETRRMLLKHARGCLLPLGIGTSESERVVLSMKLEQEEQLMADEMNLMM